MRIRRVAAVLVALTLSAAPACATAYSGVPAMQTVTGTRLTAVADRVARAAVGDAERALAPAFTLTDQSVPLGTVAIAPSRPQVNATYVSVPVAITIDGRVARTVYAGYRITTYIRTTVAAHDLAPETVLGAADLTVARLPFNGRAGLDPTVFVGRKTHAAIARGAILYPELTAVNEIVRAGLPAVFIVHDGPVALAADVIARTSGGLGDIVTIYNPQTQKAISGIVTGPNTVELTLPGANE